ncbi:MAG: NAD(P)H-hydrate epimerase [Planctomycetota bacterium]
MKVVTREQMKQLETLTATQFHIPHLILMENAGRASAQAAQKFLRDLGKDPRKSRIVIVCGSGNNGGDGAVAARHLHNMGIPVQVILTRDIHGVFREKGAKAEKGDSAESQPEGGFGDAALNFKILKAFGVSVKVLKEGDAYPLYFSGADLIIDAILGTGLDRMTGNLKPPLSDLIMAINELEIPVLSLDVPSGLDCNTGALAGCAIDADRTLAYGLPKKGFYESMGPMVCGDIQVADISIPRKLMRAIKDAGSEDDEA